MKKLLLSFCFAGLVAQAQDFFTGTGLGSGSAYVLPGYVATNTTVIGGTSLLQYPRFGGIRWTDVDTISGQQPQLLEDVASDRSSYYIGGCPTTGVNGQYKFAGFTNDVNTGATYWYTNLTATFKLWFPYDNTIYYLEDCMITPFSQIPPIDQTTSDAFDAAVTYKKHNLAQAIRLPAFWYTNDVSNLQFTNMFSDWKTNHMDMAFSVYSRAADFVHGFVWAPTTASYNTEVGHVVGLAMDRWVIATPYTFTTNTWYTNYYDEYTIQGNVFLNPTLTTRAEMEVIVIDTTANFDANNESFMDHYVTNRCIIGELSGIAAVACNNFSFKVGPLSRWYFTETNNQAGAVAYVTNCVVHN